jgi:ATP-binding cassette subfamily G (WHITE) protein 2
VPCRKTKDGVCPVTSGQQTIDTLGLGELSIAANAGILIAFITICRIVAFLGIRYIKW